MELGDLIEKLRAIDLPKSAGVWAGDGEPLTEVSWDDLECHGLDPAVDQTYVWLYASGQEDGASAQTLGDLIRRLHLIDGLPKTAIVLLSDDRSTCGERLTGVTVDDQGRVWLQANGEHVWAWTKTATE